MLSSSPSSSHTSLPGTRMAVGCPALRLGLPVAAGGLPRRERDNCRKQGLSDTSSDTCPESNCRKETHFRQMLRQLSWIQLSEGTAFRQMLRQFLHRGRRGDDGAPGAGSPHPIAPSPFPPSGGKGGTMPAGTLSRRAEGEHCARKGVS
jgi:hypothetical protein